MTNFYITKEGDFLKLPYYKTKIVYEISPNKKFINMFPTQVREVLDQLVH